MRSCAEAAMAAKKGMNILDEMTELVPEFPDRSIMVRRSYLDKERQSVKGFLPAISEGIVMRATQGSLSIMSQLPHSHATKVFVNWLLSRGRVRFIIRVIF
jgi:hypothetical protein